MKAVSWSLFLYSGGNRMSIINILFVGDVFGRTGRAVLHGVLPEIKREYEIDVCIVNGENASHGRGLSLQSADEIYLAGADCITMGNHTWNNNDIYQYIDAYPIIRPANFSASLPGKGSILLENSGYSIGVVNLQGRVYMDPCDNPFESAYEIVSQLREQTSVILLDFHAEATAEKAAMAYYLDGLVTAVVGTHTHVQTADERILPGGTAFITDVGMTGPHDGIIGMDKSGVLNKFVRCVPQKFKPAEGNGILHAVIIKADTDTGRSLEIKRLRIECESDGK